MRGQAVDHVRLEAFTKVGSITIKDKGLATLEAFSNYFPLTTVTFKAFLLENSKTLKYKGFQAFCVLSFREEMH